MEFLLSCQKVLLLCVLFSSVTSVYLNIGFIFFDTFRNRDLTLQQHKYLQVFDRKYLHEITVVITWCLIMRSLLYCQRAEQAAILLKNKIATKSHRIFQVQCRAMLPCHAECDQYLLDCLEKNISSKCMSMLGQCGCILWQ